MASVKRKVIPTNESFVRSQKTDGPPPKKRSRREEETARTPQNQTGFPSNKSNLKTSNLLKIDKDEAAFPRGGASVLTPLEHKQINIEATRDVLFEQQIVPRKNSQHAQKKTVGEVAGATKNQKSRKKGWKVAPTQADEEEIVKIEGLSYKRLVRGSLVLGQISQINENDLALALPNNLTGYVPITSISDTLTKKLEKLAALENSNNSDSQNDGEEIELSNLFRSGQYLRALVVSTNDETTSNDIEKRKRRIELSLRPSDANSSIAVSDLIPCSMVMASIVSVEDHGIVMDLGLLDSDVRGFMSTKELGHGVNASTLQTGAVLLCMITGLSSNGKIVKLSADMHKIASMKKSNYLAEAPSVDAFLPGTAVELLVADVTARGIAGKIMGMIDATADLIHSGAGGSRKDLGNKYQRGTKIKARIICNFPAAANPKLGVSLLDHVMSFDSRRVQQNGHSHAPTEILQLSTIVEEAVIEKVEPGVGLFVDLGVKGVLGFVHISRVSDEKVEALSESTGPYKIGSVHRSRVIGYNPFDGIYLVSLEPKVLRQAFLRIEDVKIGDIVKGKVEKLIVNFTGVGGLLVTLSDGITGLVPEMHMADVSLLHPERKFKEGMNVTARVLSTDLSRRSIRLTLKKTLVNSESSPIKSYEDIAPGMQSPGTIVNILPTGAVVQFYGNVRGFLPVSEMSESYIQDPNQHFRIGQVVNVHLLKVDVGVERLLVSCKDPLAFGLVQQNALKDLNIGELVSATVMEKSNEDIIVEIKPSAIRAVLPLEHLTDGSSSKNASVFKKIRTGQTLERVLVIDKNEQKRLVILTNKPTLVRAAEERTLLRNIDDVKQGNLVHGFIKNITTTAIFVQFGGSLTGLLPKSKLPDEVQRLPDFGFRRSQSLTVKILSVDGAQHRFLLSLHGLEDSTSAREDESVSPSSIQSASNPVDQSIKSVNDLTLGKLTSARIASIKETQINVQLADNIQGRIDVSQVFDSWDDIKDRKHPLKNFTSKQVISVRVLGTHDARNHRFLPITHRAAKNPVFELSAKPSDQTDLDKEALTLDKVEVGSSWIVFVNNIGEECIWVNLSPNVRGRIRILDISDDISVLKDLIANFPVGSAMRVHVTAVDIPNNRIDLSARLAPAVEKMSFQNLTKNMVTPAKVTRVNQRQIMVQLSDEVSGPVNLTDLADDFAEANPMVYSKNDIIRVCITDIDTSNKRLRLSTRPSRVLNSSSPVKDPEISSIGQLKVNAIVRGFIKNVADNGIFVNLGGNLAAYVRVSDLSDSYIKDWKTSFQIDQLVEGKVIQINPSLNHVQLSLKSSVIDKDFVRPLTFNDLTIGQVVTGKVRKVENFGVFIVLDGSANVSGLCHRSEMADNRTENVQKLYEEGDSVKAKILKVDLEKKRINLGLKASYFEKDYMDDTEGNVGTDVRIRPSSQNSDDEDRPVAVNVITSSRNGVDQNETQISEPLMQDNQEEANIKFLETGGFDWTFGVLDDPFGKSDLSFEEDEEDGGDQAPRRKIRRKAAIKVDKTGELDINGPQSISDFERLLIGQPDSSQLWIEYMAYHVKFGELSKGREVAERAFRTINIREDTEKMNVWIALLNLENTYGTDETVDEVFKRACQYNDAQEIHERLISIYIQSEKHIKADELFQALVKKFSQSPSVWYNYAHFLHQTLSLPDRARLLLPRAVQSLPTHTHLNLTIKFASLEFGSPHGSPERGRTMFEGVLTTFPKRLDIWNQLLDLESHQGDQQIIRGLFERAAKIKGIKPRGAKAWFKRWSEWEEKNGDSKSQETVRAKAEEWVRAISDNKE